MNIKKYKKSIFDIFYSAFAYALPTVVLILVIQPFIARTISPDENGLFLTELNIIRLCMNIFVASLANIRLLEKNRCIDEPADEKKFNFLFLVALLLCGLISVVVCFIYAGSFDLIDFILLACVIILYSIHDYYSIQYRINLTFSKNVIDNLFIIAGFFAGMYFFKLTGKWELIFVCGYLFGTIYVTFTNNMMKKGLGQTPDKNICVRYAELGASSALNSSVNYCDKLIIYPALGGDIVSIYNAASAVSKIIEMVSVPLRNVLLSYLVGKDIISISPKMLRKFIIIGIALVLTVFAGCVGVGVVLCRILYPMFFEDAIIYIPIINLTIVIETIANLMNLILLNFAKTKIQTLVSGIKLILYLLFVFAFLFVFKIGLMGFCIAALIVSVIKCAIIVFQTKKYIVISKE